MVRITNAYGDQKRGTQGEAVYQLHYGRQMRRSYKEHKDAGAPAQLQQRGRFQAGISWWKSLTQVQRAFLKSYMTDAGITSPEGLETTLYSFCKKIAMTVPKVEMSTAPPPTYEGIYEDWANHKQLTLSNSTGGDLVSYPVAVTLTPATFEYAECNADGSDLRFSENDRETALYYFIDTWNYGATSLIYIMVPSLPSGGKAIIIHYGKADAASESNAFNAFNTFDDNEDGDYTTNPTWTPQNGGIEISTTNPKYGTKCLKSKQGSGGSGDYSVAGYVGDNLTDFVYEGWAKPTQNDWGCLIFRRSAATTFYAVEFTPTYDIISLRRLINAVRTNLGDSATFTLTLETWYKFKIEALGTSLRVYIDDVLRLDKTDSGIASGYCGIGGYRDANNRNIAVDNIRVRKLANPEPTGTIGDDVEPGSGLVLTAFTIKHPAILSYTLIDVGIQEDGLSNLEDHISTIVSRANLNVVATAIKVTTLADQEYTFQVQ